MKRTLFAASILVATFSLASLALAEPGAGGPRQGKGLGMRRQGGMKGQRKMMNLRPEQRAKMQEMRNKHQAQPCNGDSACMEARRAERDAILNPAQSQAQDQD